MGSAITGNQGRGATSKMTCVDVAALFAAAILRRNPDSIVIPFDTAPHAVQVDPNDSILSLAKRLAINGGGTDCAQPLIKANRDFADRSFAACILVSDNCSWSYGQEVLAVGRNGSTGVMTEWTKFVSQQRRLRNQQSSDLPDPKLI